MTLIVVFIFLDQLRKGKTDFEKYCAPLLYLSGMKVMRFVATVSEWYLYLLID